MPVYLIIFAILNLGMLEWTVSMQMQYELCVCDWNCVKSHEIYRWYKAIKRISSREGAVVLYYVRKHVLYYLQVLIYNHEAA